MLRRVAQHLFRSIRDVISNDLFLQHEELKLIDHVSIGVSDMTRSRAFYDAALKSLGYTALSEDSESLGYGKDHVQLWVNTAEKPVTPDLASGLHLCFSAPTRESVKAFFVKALGAGGSDNGRPGLRADYGPSYFAAFVIDPNGYRIEAYYNEE